MGSCGQWVLRSRVLEDTRVDTGGLEGLWETGKTLRESRLGGPMKDIDRNRRDP